MFTKEGNEGQVEQGAKRKESMKMTVIEECQDQLNDWFNNNKPRYDKEVSECEAMSGGNFERSIPAHVFSGKIDDPTIVFISLNPKKNADNLNPKEPVSSKQLKDNFEHLKDVNYPTFKRMNDVADKRLSFKSSWRYEALHKYCVVIDFVPFYSDGASFSVKTLHFLFKKQVTMIEGYLSQVNPPYVITIATSLSVVFHALAGIKEHFYPYPLPMPPLSEPGVRLKEYNSSRRAWVSHALTAFGITADFYKNFLPTIIKGETK